MPLDDKSSTSHNVQHSILQNLPPELQERLLEAELKDDWAKLTRAIKQERQDIGKHVESLLNKNCSLSYKCHQLDINTLIKDNVKSAKHIALVCTSIDYLRKYGFNLLDAKRTATENWRSISLTNTCFLQKIDVMKGAIEILGMLGYTERTKLALAFPMEAEPLADVVVPVLAELLLVKMELDAYREGTHPFPSNLETFLPTGVRVRQKVQAASPAKAPAPAPSPTPAPRAPAPAPAPRAPAPAPAPRAPAPAPAAKPVPCVICNEAAVLRCAQCEDKALCLVCDGRWHGHNKRQNHDLRRSIAPGGGGGGGMEQTSTERPMPIMVIPGKQPNVRSRVQQFESAVEVDERQSFIDAITQTAPGTLCQAQKSSPALLPHRVLHETEVSNPLLPALSIFKGSPNNTGELSDSVRPGVPPPRLPWVGHPNIPTVVEDFRMRSQECDDMSVLTSLEAAGDVTQQTEKVAGLRRELEHRLSFINAGLERRDLDTRLKLMRRQNYLKQMESDLQRQAAEERKLLDLVRLPPTIHESAAEESNQQTGTNNWAQPTNKHKNSAVESAPSAGKAPKPAAKPSRFATIRAQFTPETAHTTATHAATGSAGPIKDNLTQRLNAGNPVRSSMFLTTAKAEDLPIYNMAPSVHLQEPSAGARAGVSPQEPAAGARSGVGSQLSRDPPPDDDPSDDYGNYEEINECLMDRISPAYEDISFPPSAAPGGEPCRAPGEGSPGGQEPADRVSRTLIRSTSDNTYVAPASYSIAEQEGDEAHAPATPKRAGSSPTVRSRFEGWPYRWHCEHCTLVNEPGTRVCLACDKTSDQPEVAAEEQGTSVCQQREDLPIYLAQGNAPVPNGSNRKDARPQPEDTLTNGHSTLTPCPAQSPQGKEHAELGRQLIEDLRLSENTGFNLEEFELAVSKSQQDKAAASPVDWLLTEWQVRIDKVVAMANDKIKATHPQAKISRDEVRESLVINKADVEEAAKSCINGWTTKYEELMTNLSQSHAPDPDIAKQVVFALNRCHGDMSEATNQLFLAQVPALLESIRLEGASQREELFQIIENKNIDRERKIRMLLCEFGMKSWGRADLALRLLEEPDSRPATATVGDVIEAAQNCGDRAMSRRYLNQECAVCLTAFPASQIYSLGCCQCKIDVHCLKQHFSIVIREKHVKDLKCPNCALPDVANREQFEQHVEFLHLLLPNFLSHEDYELFEHKLRDWHLMQDPAFRWCSYDDCHCGIIFAGEAGRQVMTCPQCNRKTCFDCKKPWQEQHEGLTCEAFQQWMIDNDPETQERGLVRHLEENGIDCPQCKSRYALAKGGCMHFVCRQCGHDFCSGCAGPFLRNKTCPLEHCQGQGLHCHHPRQCLYYLRNEEVKDLQKLLQEANVAYDNTTPIVVTTGGRCQTMEQRETPDGVVDQRCGKDAPVGHAGLCESHYKEYLVSVINRNHVDPVTVLDLAKVKQQFVRTALEVPEKVPKETDLDYKLRLVEIIKRDIPLERLPR